MPATPPVDPVRQPINQPEQFSSDESFGAADRAAVLKRGVADLHAVWRALGEEVTGDWLELDLSMAQLKTLFVIDREPQATITLLSDRLGVGPPATSLLVEKLVRAGLAVRTEDRLDRRRVQVGLTPGGAQLLARLRHGSQALLETWLGELSQAELEALARGLAALLRVAARRRAGAGGATGTGGPAG
jgi:DNA-binding MarR family transcriptional regulator